jgi:hypothetical protein
MEQEKSPCYWVAIRVWRGFPVEAKAFRKKINANRQERIWRRTINPDYDETEVLPLSIERNFSE